MRCCIPTFTKFVHILAVLANLNRVSIGKRENDKRSKTANLCTNLMKFDVALVKATLHTEFNLYIKLMKVGKRRFQDIAYMHIFFKKFPDHFPARISLVHK